MQNMGIPKNATSMRGKNQQNSTIYATQQKLFAALYDIKKVDLISGKIDDAKFVEVPYIILDWGLTHPPEFEMEEYKTKTESVYRYDAKELKEKIKSRPIFIVNSGWIIPFLKKLNFK